MGEKILAEISSKLDKLIALTAIQGKSDEKQAQILKSLGFTYAEISKLICIPEGTLKSRDKRKRGQT